MKLTGALLLKLLMSFSNYTPKANPQNLAPKAMVVVCVCVCVLGLGCWHRKGGMEEKEWQ